MLFSLVFLVVIVGIRTYIYDWSERHSLMITVIEVVFNSMIVIDFFRNLIDAPEKMEFIFSMYNLSFHIPYRYGLFNFAAGIPVIIVTVLPRRLFLVYFFVVEYIPCLKVFDFLHRTANVLLLLVSPSYETMEEGCSGVS